MSGVRARSRTLSILVGWTLFASAMSACGPGQVDEPGMPGTECGISTDQLDTFMPRVDTDAPVQVDIDPAFRGDRHGFAVQIEGALQAWNRVGEEIRGKPFFTYAYDSRSRTAGLPKKKGDCDFESGTRGQFQILRDENAKHWEKMGLDDSIPGVTVRCYSGGALTHQVVLLNTQYAAKQGTLSQFAGITLHEAGHALGLDHSCEYDSKDPRFAACDGLKQTHPYYEAIMFPVFRLLGASASVTELKQSVRKNDTVRASCLYRDL